MDSGRGFGFCPSKDGESGIAILLSAQNIYAKSIIGHNEPGEAIKNRSKLPETYKGFHNLTDLYCLPEIKPYVLDICPLAGNS